MGNTFLIAGIERLALAKKLGEEFINVIIFDYKDVKTFIIQKAIKKAGSGVELLSGIDSAYCR
jgi:hypothetical protein